MASSVNFPEDVVNIALVRLGYKGRVSNLFDGSAAAKKALDVYSQTRDNALKLKQWGFAQRIALAAASGSAAPFPWSYEWVYPADCIELRQVLNDAAYQADQNNPLPVLYRVGNDLLNGIGTKVIWSKVTPLRLVYTAQITNPAQWDDPTFVDVLVSMLVKQLAPMLADLNAAGLATKDADAVKQGAEDDVE